MKIGIDFDLRTLRINTLLFIEVIKQEYTCVIPTLYSAEILKLGSKFKNALV